MYGVFLPSLVPRLPLPAFNVAGKKPLFACNIKSWERGPGDEATFYQGRGVSNACHIIIMSDDLMRLMQVVS